MKNKLRELREAREWSQGRLAEELGVSRQTVNAIETGKYDPSLPLAFKLARLFRLPIEAVFDDGEGGVAGNRSDARRGSLRKGGAPEDSVVAGPS